MEREESGGGRRVEEGGEWRREESGGGRRVEDGGEWRREESGCSYPDHFGVTILHTHTHTHTHTL